MEQEDYSEADRNWAELMHSTLKEQEEASSELKQPFSEGDFNSPYYAVTGDRLYQFEKLNFLEFDPVLKT